MESAIARPCGPPRPLLTEDPDQIHKPLTMFDFEVSIRAAFESIKITEDFSVVARFVDSDIFEDVLQNLRLTETKKRPETDYMTKLQRHINPRTRARCVDFLVDMAFKLCLDPETLHLAINYLDRCLSGNVMQNEKHLRFLGLTCMIIASKYEEVRETQVGIDVFVELTMRTLSVEDFIRMERYILSYLKYEVTGPTTWTFLKMFIHAAHGGKEAPSQSLECMASYIAELSLFSYCLLRFLPSLVAASSVFLARYILDPSRMPWNATLQHYTTYQPSDLQDCVLDLHWFCYKSGGSNMPMIRMKYSMKKYESVAMKSPPPSIPLKAFQNFNC